MFADFYYRFLVIAGGADRWIFAIQVFVYLQLPHAALGSPQYTMLTRRSD
jgi:hypothetical protein